MAVEKLYTSKMKTTLIFGDSFVGPFYLLDNDNIEVIKFKGATMRGLAKEQNQNRKYIYDKVKNTNIQCAIFYFGQVDLHHSYYYKEYEKGEEFNPRKIVNEYIDFINSLPFSNKKKVVLSIFPSFLNKEYIRLSLQKYGVISNETKIPKSDLTQHSRNQRNKIMNNHLQNLCENNNITYIDFNKYLFDNKGYIKKEYKHPVNSYSIHPHFEKFILLLVKELKDCGLYHKYKEDLQRTLENYINEKKEELANRRMS